MTNKTRGRKRKFRHLTHLDRDRIEALLNAGHRQKEIAEVIQVDKGTISREINNRKRKDGRYESAAAHHKAQVARSNSKHQGMKIEEFSELRRRIIEGLEAKQSPDAISGRMKEEGVSPAISAKTVYRWLYSSWGQRYCHLLCARRYKKRRQKRTAKREMIKDAVPLAKRPRKGIYAEGDLFVSSKASRTSRSGAIVVVPAAQLMVGKMIENRKPVAMARAIRMLGEEVCFDDITMDRGIENKNHKDFDVPAYFCDPHSPWQKPHVEQSIGLLRRWFIKKKTDLRTVSEDDPQRYLHILNGKWRKSLGYKSAYEAAAECGILKTKNLPWSREIINNQKVAFRVTI